MSRSELSSYSRVRNENIDCHRFSGMATQCVELFGTDIERIDIEAPSLSFLQEKNKTLKIRGGAYEVLINYFIFELHSMHAIQLCCQECTASYCHNFNTLRGRNSSSASFSRQNLEVGGVSETPQ